jgi:hypothetical protein
MVGGVICIQIPETLEWLGERLRYKTKKEQIRVLLGNTNGDIKSLGALFEQSQSTESN